MSDVSPFGCSLTGGKWIRCPSPNLSVTLKSSCHEF
ncbi:hypothetical protein RB7984 [Rhodopirellula baltica SH 1]|uniref:Uncharacterized protein n=1 Tax=Rhodopirellula baltica (strain DSM 10527 / NCIMB 13988 / SH1) TaxID=243090 RepID=Q7UGC3_RHOBA|nr:hypothetical protein RB7984 [Rhodopirellula baltica SH 1]